MKKIIPNDAQSPEPSRGLEGNKPSVDIFNRPIKRQKAQISSVPGVSPKILNRYQVKVGDEVIAADLTCDEALAIAKGGES